MSVVVRANLGTSKPMATGKSKILRSTSRISLERSTPAPSPTARLNRAINSVSQPRILAMWRFSRPKML